MTRGTLVRSRAATEGGPVGAGCGRCSRQVTRGRTGCAPCANGPHSPSNVSSPPRTLCSNDPPHLHSPFTIQHATSSIHHSTSSILKVAQAYISVYELSFIIISHLSSRRSFIVLHLLVTTNKTRIRHYCFHWSRVSILPPSLS